MKKTAEEILTKYEDENEYHLHQSDREWVFQAMHEFANQSRWISVEDRLPEDEDDVLLIGKDGGHYLGYRLIKQFWDNSDGSMLKNITHWMEIPSVPREEDRNEIVQNNVQNLDN